MIGQLQQRIDELQALINTDPHSVNVARYKNKLSN